MEMGTMQNDKLILTLSHTPEKHSRIFFSQLQVRPGGPISQKELDSIIARYNQIYEEYCDEKDKLAALQPMLALSIFCICCCAPCIVDKRMIDSSKRAQSEFTAKLNALTTLLNEELANLGLLCQLRNELVGQVVTYQNGTPMNSAAVTAHRLDIYWNPDYATTKFVNPQAQPGMSLQ